ncbi:hypothetical protein A2U01_0101968, partial [Trifolium medium]|nr:hypothetical protein [Trifolium medium]
VLFPTIPELMVITTYTKSTRGVVVSVS